MKNVFFISLILISIYSISACSKKVNPSKTETSKTEEVKRTEAADAAPATSTTPEKPAPVVVKKTTPKSITLNDAVAKKSVDGRLYYDLEGKRYWKNYKDGKYYIFNQSMNGNPDYKPRN